ncbi:hypothetical protein BD626DRAFT_573261 [Schizophyllum amplum]|uniref:NAD(P)-binding domain-containing protein n=1 Tax=Schizophyllum amplum TaxID=97359 RepID=A0A550C1S9_9AGAR|nr:hypothetical protein BD626DRAFT_573261 [Auriculariopsis ampla]
MSTKSALILGATGQTGGYLLKELLASPHFSKVGEYGRRVTSADALSDGKDKLDQKAIDFENLSPSGLKDGKWDIVLGTTRKTAGTPENFEKIDREYVVNAAREARVEGHPQRLVYLFSGGANASSPFLYMRSKGLTENALVSLGYDDSIIFRPGMLIGTNRGEFRLDESIAATVNGFLSYFTNNIEMKVATLGKAIARAGILGSQALPAGVRAAKEVREGATFTTLNNAAALALAKDDV